MIVHWVKNNPLFRVVSSTFFWIFTPILHKSRYKLGWEKTPIFSVLSTYFQKHPFFYNSSTHTKSQFGIISFQGEFSYPFNEFKQSRSHVSIHITKTTCAAIKRNESLFQKISVEKHSDFVRKNSLSIDSP